MKKNLLLFPVVLLFLIVFSEKAETIPAFARKYRISCQTCHAPAMPKLKPYGDDFAGAGFQLQDYESPRYFVETGDDKLSLIRDFPLAVRMDGFITYNFSNEDKPDFAAPYLMKLLSGGNLSKHLSYYFYFYMDERGEVVGVEDAYLMYNNLFNVDLDIYLGQFQVSDPLFKRELRLTLEDYRLYTAPVGMSEISLKYDKGVMITYGAPTGTDVIVEVVNGNGLNEANDFHVFDKDTYKSFVGRLSQNIGSVLRLGVFGYYGKEELVNFEVSNNSAITNEVLFVGPDATVTPGNKLEVNLQYLIRTDSRVYLQPSSALPVTDIRTEGFLGEIIYSPQGDQSNWYTMGLYNYVNSDLEMANYHSATLHLGYLLRRNVRLAGEYTYQFTDADNAFSQVSLGFVSGF